MFHGYSTIIQIGRASAIIVNTIKYFVTAYKLFIDFLQYFGI